MVSCLSILSVNWNLLIGPVFGVGDRMVIMLFGREEEMTAKVALRLSFTPSLSFLSYSIIMFCF